MLAQRNSENELICGLISISDRASRGEYVDEGIPALEAWLHDAIITPVQFHTRLIADDRYTIEETIRELVDRVGCDLVSEWKPTLKICLRQSRHNIQN